MAHQTVCGRKLRPLSPTGAEKLTPRAYAATLLHGGSSQNLNRSSDLESEDIIVTGTSRRFRRSYARPSDVTGSAGSRADSAEDAPTTSSNNSRTAAARESREAALEPQERPLHNHIIADVRFRLEDPFRVHSSDFNQLRRFRAPFPAQRRSGDGMCASCTPRSLPPAADYA